MSIITDGEPSKKLYAFAKKQLATIVALDLPAKSVTLNGYLIRAHQQDGIEKVFISEPERTLMSSGANIFGTLGTGDTQDVQYFTPVKHRSTWLEISAGLTHAMGIQSDGSLWTWGGADDQWQSGQLGTDPPPTLKPAIIPGAWVAASAGSSFSIAIKADGTLWAWGGNLVGGDVLYPSIPTQIGSSAWDFISAAADYSFGIKTDGTLWNLNIHLGSRGPGEDGRVPYTVDSGSWMAVSAADSYCLGIKSDGSLWSWALESTISIPNPASVLGRGNIPVTYTPAQVAGGPWAAVKACATHALGVKADGTLWVWGNDTYGQLGLGGSVVQYTPVQVGSDLWSSVDGTQFQSGAVRLDGTVWRWGWGQLTPLMIGAAPRYRRYCMFDYGTGFGPYIGYHMVIAGWRGHPDYLQMKRTVGVAYNV